MGLSVFGSTATVDSVVVRGIVKNALGEYGDGVEVVAPRSLDPAFEATGPASADLSAIVVENSDRAGILFYDAGGSLGGSVVRGNSFAVALERGAEPAIGEDNAFEGNTRNDVARGLDLEPVPPLESLAVP